MEPSDVLPTRLGDESASIPAPARVVEIMDTACLPEGVLDNLGAGDSQLFLDFLNESEREQYFNQLLNGGEIDFQQWYHMPNKKGDLEPLRRVKAALANPTADGLIPHYRFPVNDQARYGVTCPMTPTVEAVRRKASEFVGCDFNHAVVLLYRNGEDCIGYHKDKTLDIDESAPIVSISLGNNRTYALRDNIKVPTVHQEFLFPSGALFKLGPRTNQTWYHSIRPEKPSSPECTEGCQSELLGENTRISLTFRKVETFCDPETGEIKGKGIAHQTLNWPVELNGEHQLLTSNP